MNIKLGNLREVSCTCNNKCEFKESGFFYMSRIAVIISTLLIFLSVPLNAQTKRALVIGIGEQQDKAWAKINGDNDVSYVTEMLSKLGYKDMIVLVNRQATKNGIIGAFMKIAKKCSEGDIVYVHFSGHGQQVTDVNGDEDDGWDEAWIPYDAFLKYDERGYRGEKHLIDDELNRMLSDIRRRIGIRGKMLVVVDACHSGDSSRDVGTDEIVRGVKDEFVIPVKNRITSRKDPELWLTLSACKDYQLNQEMNNPHVGKLTYALYSLYEKEGVTLDNVCSFIQNHRGRYAQTPVLTGELSACSISDFFR